MHAFTALLKWMNMNIGVERMDSDSIGCAVFGIWNLLHFEILTLLATDSLVFGIVLCSS